MRRKTAQRFLIASGILVLVGGGSCFLVCNNAPIARSSSGGFVFSSLIALGIAAILGLLGLIGLFSSRRDN
jgi:hypothetical protein